MADGGNPRESSDLAAHDVLAAEEFAVPASDPSISHPPVVLPDDPSGIAEPHDVLAAEEFAMPAPPPHPEGGPGGRGAAAPRRGMRIGAAAAALGGVAVVVLVTTLRRGRGRV